MNVIPPPPPLDPNFRPGNFTGPPPGPPPGAALPLPAFSNMLTTIVAGVCFLLGLCLSVFRFGYSYGRMVGMGLLCILGAMSFSLSMVLARAGFLLPKYFPNWIFIVLWIAIAAVLTWRKPKIGMVSAKLSF